MHRKKILALSLVLALSLALCACGESGGNDTADQAGPLSGGTWTEQPDGSTDPMEYMTTILQDDIPEDWTLPEDVSIGSQTRVEIQGDKILYGETIDGGLIQDLTVAQYADGSLTTLYHFDGGVVRSWQLFFSPDGSKIVLAWAPSAEETDQWNLSVVDLSTGEASMVDLPEMTFPVTITNEETGETSEETKNAELLLVKWQDDSNLVVLGSLQNYSTTQAPYIWLYTLRWENKPPDRGTLGPGFFGGWGRVQPWAASWVAPWASQAARREASWGWGCLGSSRVRGRRRERSNSVSRVFFTRRWLAPAPLAVSRVSRANR